MSGIFDTLDALQTKQSAKVTRLPAEQKRTLHPFVLMKWLASSTNPNQVLAINEFANEYIHTVTQLDRDAGYELLAACTSGRKERLAWRKRPPVKKQEDIRSRILIEAFGAVTEETLTDDELYDLGLQLGFQQEELNSLVPFEM